MTSQFKGDEAVIGLVAQPMLVETVLHVRFNKVSFRLQCSPYPVWALFFGAMAGYYINLMFISRLNEVQTSPCREGKYRSTKLFRLKEPFEVIYSKSSLKAGPIPLDKVTPGILCLSIVYLSTDGQSTASQILQPVPSFGDLHYRKKKRKSWYLTMISLVTVCLLPLFLSLCSLRSVQVCLLYILQQGGWTVKFSVCLLWRLNEPCSLNFNSYVKYSNPWLTWWLCHIFSYTGVSTTGYSGPDVVL